MPDSDTLPKFRPRPPESVRVFAARVLLPHDDGTREVDTTFLRDLIAYPDGHFRVIFGLDYFVLADGATEPTKSQWNTLKKKFKRYDAQVFMFKEHGLLTHDNEACGYLEFGFFVHPAPGKPGPDQR